MMRRAFLAVLVLGLAPGAGAQEKQREILLGGSETQGSKRRILFFTKSSGFEHSVIKKPDDKPSHAEKVLMELAGKNNWEVVHTKDGGVFTAENLAKFDAFFFYTTGDLTTPGKDNGKPMT
ncbi:MAG: ThuA domain-containing protein, partial [Vicinamibacteria bacterium]